MSSSLRSIDRDPGDGREFPHVYVKFTTFFRNRLDMLLTFGLIGRLKRDGFCVLGDLSFTVGFLLQSSDVGVQGLKEFP